MMGFLIASNIATTVKERKETSPLFFNMEFPVQVPVPILKYFPPAFQLTHQHKEYKNNFSAFNVIKTAIL